MDFIQTLQASKKTACLRPRSVPCAPHNSSQFIMEEHSIPHNEFQSRCLNNIYETNGQMEKMYQDHNSNLILSHESDERDNVHSVDYEATMNFMIDDFNHVYEQAKEKALAQLSKEELIEKILFLRNKLNALDSHAKK